MKIRSMVAAIAVLTATGSAFADPAADFAAAKKQIEADFKTASTACKQAPKAERKACNGKAKADKTAAFSEAKKQLDAAKTCPDCGSVVEVKERSVQGEGSGLGAAAGAAAGGLLGKQIGKGKGNTAATVAGALVGGLAGHEAEKAIGSHKAYDYVVKLNNGKTETVVGKDSDSAPLFKAGDKVKYRDGALTAQ
ncbi:MAG: glycine zipper 2TM domain-containing protein [Chitinivorax sp.]